MKVNSYYYNKLKCMKLNLFELSITINFENSIQLIRMYNDKKLFIY